MKLGWFSKEHFNYLQDFFINKNPFVVYEKPNGEYAVVTIVGEHTESIKHRSDTICQGELGRCIFYNVQKVNSFDQLDAHKMESACDSANISIEELRKSIKGVSAPIYEGIIIKDRYAKYEELKKQSDLKFGIDPHVEKFLKDFAKRLEFPEL